MRNNTNYSQTAALSALQLVAGNPRVILENFYRKSRNAVDDGTRNAPHGFVIPAGQRDMTRVVTLVNQLRIQGVEIGRAGTEVVLGGATYPTGSFVIKATNRTSASQRSSSARRNSPTRSYGPTTTPGGRWA